MPNAEAVDLTNCDREPIHIPGSIQPHGCLIACTPDAGHILCHSANAADVLHLPSAGINGLRLEAVLGGKAAHDIRNALTTATDPSRPGLLLGLNIGERAFDVAVHIYKGVVIIECEAAPKGRSGTPVEFVRALISQVSRLGEPDVLLRRASHLVRTLLGYDRVMIYRFDADGSGKVVSEARMPSLESFLGQHFPAGDIPRQARELYLKNIIRIVSDSSGARIPMEPEFNASGEPLDLSFAHLRSVSPIHCEYLRNMGVSASMSLSIVIGGQLWGLIACHHYSPRVLSMAERIGAEMFAEFFSLHLEAVNHREKLEVATRARRTLDRILGHAARYAGLPELLRGSLADFMGLMPCDGVGLWIEGEWTSHGVALPAPAAPALARAVATHGEGPVWASHTLSHILPEASAYGVPVAGALAISLSHRPRDYLFFFRKEAVQTVEWAGNPHKHYATGIHGDRLTPRKSFAIWKETVEHQSWPWTQADRDIAEAARNALVEIVLRHNELLADERGKADVRQRLLNEELNHRVKNILALIKSLVSHPVTEATDVASYSRSLKGRIEALAYAHDQVVRGDGGGLLSDLLTAELSPYRDATAVTLDGRPLMLDAQAFSVMALVFHEMATNAAKYGSLSTPGGRLMVRWVPAPAGGCDITWEESGGPPVQAAGRRGFGSVLVDRSVPYDLGGFSAIEYLVSGVKARFSIPGRHITWQGSDPRTVAPTSASDAPPPDDLPLRGLSLLVVEDQLLIAMEAEAMLLALGAEAVETCNSALEAENRLARFRPDAAVLDIHLSGGTSVPVAQELRRRQIPFVFASGYADLDNIPDELADVPLARKPYDGKALAFALTQARAEAGV